MSNLSSSSPASAVCRIEWRPSALGQTVLLLLTLLSVGSVLVAELPLLLRAALAPLVLLGGVVEVRRYRRAMPCLLEIPAGAAAIRCDGVPVRSGRLLLRGGLTFSVWVLGDGQVRRYLFWPDVLPASGQRELKLALLRRRSAGKTAPMAR